MSTYIERIGAAAAAAAQELNCLTTEQKNACLLAAAKALVDRRADILLANEEDLKKAEEKGMRSSMVDRLRLTASRIEDMAEGLRQVAALPDPLGEVMMDIQRPNGLQIRQIRVPMGVVGIIYEARPSDAISSNRAITAVLRQTLEEQGITPDAVCLVEDTSRESAQAMMRLRGVIDVLIPRGGAGLIRSVVESSTVPVIETGSGNCHIYVDKDADLSMAVRIIHNAKTQRISVCNACESLVIHSEIAEKAIPMIAEDLLASDVEIRGDEKVCSLVPQAIRATEEDWGMEYLDRIISIKVVDFLEDAVRHINRYNTKHSEAIITENPEASQYFMQQVDAACVYVNASTRFTDGFEFGFGAEIGISTQKLHARGPMGLTALTTTKYEIIGNGQIRG